MFFSQPGSRTPPNFYRLRGGVCGHQVRIPALCNLCHLILLREHLIRLFVCVSCYLGIMEWYKGTDTKEMGVRRNAALRHATTSEAFYILYLG